MSVYAVYCSFGGPMAGLLFSEQSKAQNWINQNSEYDGKDMWIVKLEVV
jgi:hypothetical protein